MSSIEEKVVLDLGRIEYVAKIHPEEYAVEPDWFNYKTYAPDLRHFRDSGAPDVWVSDAPDELLAVEEEYGEWNDLRMARFAKLYRHQDPDGVYLAATYNQDRYSGDAITIHDAPDENREQGNILLYMTSKDCEYHKIKAEEAGKWIHQEVKVWNAWADGEVYYWTLVRQVLDEDGDVVMRKSVDSCGGYYGSDEWEYMYECAKESAEAHELKLAEDRARFMEAESGMALLV